MRILAIDTSFDDTSLAILEWKDLTHFKLLFNLVSSQAKLHQAFGGVWPHLAKLEHKKNLPLIFSKIKEMGFAKNIDVISVTVGPGLEPCLWEGINFSKNLEKELSARLIPVNHLEAHIFSVFFDKNFRKDFKKDSFFPAISLIVSGGHTILVLVENLSAYKMLGETRDDAAGECLDKVARFLGFPYPGGPIIEKLAKKSKKKYNISLPRPMMGQKNYQFSFSGLKTAVIYLAKRFSDKERKSKDFAFDVAREVQNAVFDVLIDKTKRAVQEFKAKSVFVVGGVAANKKLREDFKKGFQELKDIKIFFPPKIFCTDNAAMVGLVGGFYFSEKINFSKIQAFGNLKISEKLYGTS
jgi:N6-L-threonylcarbamoyladenine synthase